MCVECKWTSGTINKHLPGYENFHVPNGRDEASKIQCQSIVLSAVDGHRLTRSASQIITRSSYLCLGWLWIASIVEE